MLMNLYYNTQKTDSKCNWVMDSLNKGWPLSRPMRDRQYHGGPSSFWGFIDANWSLIQEHQKWVASVKAKDFSFEYPSKSYWSAGLHPHEADELEEIKICVEYELNGKKINYLPAASEDQFNIKPIYKTFPGWKSSTQGIRNIKDLPEKAKNYIYALEDFIGAKISSISTSPERDDTILIEDPFKS